MVTVVLVGLTTPEPTNMKYPTPITSMAPIRTPRRPIELPPLLSAIVFLHDDLMVFQRRWRRAVPTHSNYRSRPLALTGRPCDNRRRLFRARRGI